ncbi:MAG: putative toxin-antitoxin system toxin component, PIN family [Thermomicrobiales bacterium]
MKVCLDANILISYLLKVSSESPLAKTIQACFRSDVTLVLPSQVLVEIRRSAEGKDYLRERISTTALNEFLEAFEAVAIVPEPLAPAIPSCTRDRFDDYLIAHVIAEGVDLLISGDRDLLSLGSVLDVHIVSPTSFVAILEAIDRRS